MRGRQPIAREGERERDLDRRTVGLLALALEAQGLGCGDLRSRERACIGCSIGAFENQQREPLARLQEAPVEIAEQNRDAIVAELRRLRHRQHLDEEAWQLHDVIMRAPGVAVARADREAKPPVQIGAGIEIAHGMDDVIEAPGHGFGTLPKLT